MSSHGTIHRDMFMFTYLTKYAKQEITVIHIHKCTVRSVNSKSLSNITQTFQ